MGDDGFGPHVVEVLRASYEPAPNTSFIDAGTPGMDLTSLISGTRSVIIIDSVVSEARPGSIRTYSMDELLATPPPDRLSPHQPGLREALMAAELTDTTPAHLVLIGVVPVSTETSTALSDPVREAVPAAVHQVVTELEGLGAAPTPRTPPGTPDLWWERKDAP
jgi:hydrogenase maturation protease